MHKLLTMKVVTHMLRAFGTVSLIKFVQQSHSQSSRNISKLSCSMTDCFDCFSIISAIIYLFAYCIVSCKALWYLV